MTGGFPSQRVVNNTENVSTWWRHHVLVWWHIKGILHWWQEGVFSLNQLYSCRCWIPPSHHEHIEAETKWPPFSRRQFLEWKTSLKYIPNGPVNNYSSLVEMMAWRRSGDKPLSQPMIVYLTGGYRRHSASMSFKSARICPKHIFYNWQHISIGQTLKLCQSRLCFSFCYHN